MVLKGLYIEDQAGDTLAYFGKLKTNFNINILFDEKIQLARLKGAVIENTKFNMLIHKGETDFNYQFIVDYFSPPSHSKGPFVPFKLFIKKLELKNVDYCYRDENLEAPTDRRFDESHMVYHGIEGIIQPFKLIGDSLSLGIEKLHFKEKSGIEMREFSAQTTISSTVMEFENMVFKTPYSRLGNYLKFSYKNYAELSDFVSKVKWDAKLSNSIVNMKDVAFFSNSLLTYHFPVTLEGKVSGTLEKLRGKKVEIKAGSLNRLEGDILLTNLTDTRTLGFDMDITKLTANPSSIGQITHTEFPEELLRIGSIEYKGQFSGNLSDITAKGQFLTTVGILETDLNISWPENQPERYKGSIQAFDLDLQKLLNDGNFGKTNFAIQLDGMGFNIDNLKTALSGNIYSFAYHNYNYTGATFDGVLEKKLFDGKFEIADPNVNLTFNGMFDMLKENPGGEFKAKLGEVNLAKLGFGDINIKGIDQVSLNFHGSDIDDMEIQTLLNNVVLERKDSIYRLGTVDLVASGPSTARNVRLKSILGDIHISGKYKISQFNTISSNLLYDLFPDYYSDMKKEASDVDLRFDLDIIDSRFISALTLPELTYSRLNAAGVYNSANQNMDILARADYVKYQNQKFNHVDISSSKQPGQRLSLHVEAQDLWTNDSFFTDNLELQAELGANDINFKLNAADSTDDIGLRSKGLIVFSDGAVDLKLTNTSVFLHGKPWHVDDVNHMRYANSNLFIEGLKVTHGDQVLEMKGEAGTETLKDLSLTVSNFNLVEINPLLKSYGSEIEGILNGRILLNGSVQRPLVESLITVNKLNYNKDSIGNLELTTQSSGSLYKMNLEGKITNGLIHDLSLLGTLDLSPDKEKIDLKCTLFETGIEPFEILTEGLFSQLKGKANGVISVKGDLSNPEINGNLKLKNAGLFMDYLGIPLKINEANIKIDKDKIELQEFKVLDPYGSIALAGGKIHHRNFDDLKFDIYLKGLNNFNCMNLTKEQGDMFYGMAYVDGEVKVKGPIDELFLGIHAKTRAKTTISLPLTDNSENTGPDYIKLVDLMAEAPNSEVKKLSGITMDFVFDVTPEAEIKLIFDEKFNDVMNATGEGNIRMNITTFGDFEMYGYYEIAQGGYNFTALNNVVNAKLSVRQGGRITWDGQPLDAKVDLVAITTVRADPTPIITSSAVSNQSISPVNVDCEIYMKDQLFKPDIRLGINLSNDKQPGQFNNSSVSNAINQIKADQEETNKQFINLLVFNSFAPINSGLNTGANTNALTSLENSIGALVSSQVNNWLRQIDPNWEAKVDWKSATNRETNNQIIFSLKKKIYNDRIEIGGVYGQTGNSSIDVDVSYKIKKDGSLRVRAFNSRANDPSSFNNKPVNTQGLGFFYRHEKDYLFEKMRKRMYDKKQLRRARRTKKQ